MLRVLCTALTAVALLPAQAGQFTIEELLKLQRISEPQLAPDGRLVAFTVDTVELEQNRKPKHIYTVPLDGGPAVQLTKEGAANHRPRWTPDGKRIVFISDRSGSSQIWSMNPDGTDPKQLADIATEADGVVVSPDGQHLLFTSEVFPECLDQACNKTKLDAEKTSKVKARVYTSLLYRHWNAWQAPRRKHLLIVPITGGPPVDLTPGNDDVPTWNLGGPDDYAISPDSKEVAYIGNNDDDAATSTNTDVFVVPINGGEAKRITSGLGSERSPVYSPDGKYLAFRSQERAGYESDRWRLALVERSSGRQILLNEKEDRPVEEVTFSPDGARIFYVTGDRGRGPLLMIRTAGGGSRAVITGPSHVGDVQFTADGETMIYSEQSGSRPVEIFKATAGGKATRLTSLNDAVLAAHKLTPMREISVETAEKSRVHAFVINPPGFDPKTKYPLLLLIHGGPQSAWGEMWSYRWNPQVFAAAGYVVVMPNPRGSIGYGQKFTDEINADWGGKAYDDIMAVVDHMAAQPYVDGERMAAAGGSYGGYMVNWMLGRTTRFKALVSHAGVFDLRSMAGETEELWFPIWEFRGMPWDNPELYAKYSPSWYVKDFKTPTLVTHGELDYRVPVGQGLQLFTALQMQKVPSKLLLYPDEGHWILKPQNSQLWYRTFLDWVGEWTRKAASKPAQ